MTHEIALRYCGGCNPRYDRGAFVRRLQKQFPQMRIAPFSPENRYDAVLVVCGCSAQCAGQADLPADLPRFVMADLEDADRVIAFLEEINKES